MEPSFKVKKVHIYTDDASGAVRKAARIIITKTAFDVLALARRLVPVDTGNLKGNLQADVSRVDRELKAFVGTNVIYAPYVEMGTTRMVAKPFLMPAVYRSRAAFRRAFMAVLASEMAKVNAKK